MRAIVITKPGGPEVLALQERDAPEPSRGEVRIRVRATGLNRADLIQRRGYYPAPPDSPADIPGLEFAGEVETLGGGVSHLKEGQRVFGLVGGGAYAESLVTHSRAVAEVPEGLSFHEAAAAPEAFVTAYDAMVSRAGLSSGETVLISAAGSGVGTAAIQLARALRCRTLATSRTASKLESARVLGLDVGIVAKDGHYAEAVMEATDGKGVDVVLELVGGDYLAEDLRCVAPKGRIVLVGLLAGASAQIDLGLLLRKRLDVHGTVLRSRPLEEKIVAMQLFEKHVVPLLSSGVIRPTIDRTFDLSDAAEAHRYLESNEVFGKVILRC